MGEVLLIRSNINGKKNSTVFFQVVQAIQERPTKNSINQMICSGLNCIEIVNAIKPLELSQDPYMPVQNFPIFTTHELKLNFHRRHQSLNTA
jgi:hypothetical protein